MRNGPYILVIAPANYPGMKYRGRYAYEHHVVWWKVHDQVPLRGEQIHHIDKDTHNNSIENLKLLTAKEHRALHDSEKLPSIMEIPCDHCGKYFMRHRRMLLAYLKGQQRAFCSPRCIGLFGFSSRRKNLLLKLRKV